MNTITEDINEQLRSYHSEFRAIKYKGNTITVVPFGNSSYFDIREEECEMLWKKFKIDTLTCSAKVNVVYWAGRGMRMKNVHLTHKDSFLRIADRQRNVIKLDGCSFTCGGLDLSGGLRILEVQNCKFKILYNQIAKPKLPHTQGCITIDPMGKTWVWKNNVIEGNPILLWESGAQYVLDKKLEDIGIDHYELDWKKEAWTYDDDLLEYFGVPGDFGAVLLTGWTCGTFWITQKAKNKWFIQYLPD